MSTTAVPAFIAWLVNACTAAATLGAATPPVAVHCGPDLSGDFSPLALYLAVDDPIALAQGGPITGATSNQSWVGAGARQRNELLSVYGVAEAWSGDTGTSTALAAAYGIVAAVEEILRVNATSVTLGGTAQIIELTGSTGHTLRWVQGAPGLAVHVQFRIDVKARIGA